MLRLGNILIFCYIAILCSCNSTGGDKRTNYSEENSLFSPPLLITIDELKNRGYRKIDSLGEINKTVRDALISYSFINDKEPIYLRQVVKLSIDSAAVKTWINHYGGQVISSWEQTETPNSYKFFIRDQRSALIQSATFKAGTLVIMFAYPDVGDNIRSEHRRVLPNDKIEIVGKLNDGHEVSFSPTN